jgi:hypothetical protein
LVVVVCSTVVVDPEGAGADVCAGGTVCWQPVRSRAKNPGAAQVKREVCFFITIIFLLRKPHESV